MFYNVLQYAVELELLDFNPVDKLRIRPTRRKVSGEVDRRVVVNVGQARELLTAVTHVGRGVRTGGVASGCGRSTFACTSRLVSLWLNAGLPAPEVAERAGHSVDVLLKVYAKCIDGDRSRVNERIEAALRG